MKQIVILFPDNIDCFEFYVSEQDDNNYPDCAWDEPADTLDECLEIIQKKYPVTKTRDQILMTELTGGAYTFADYYEFIRLKSDIDNDYEDGEQQYIDLIKKIDAMTDKELQEFINYHEHDLRKALEYAAGQPENIEEIFEMGLQRAELIK